MPAKQLWRVRFFNGPLWSFLDRQVGSFCLFRLQVVMKALVHWKKHVLSDLGDIHMTKQLLNKKNINMDQRSLSHMSVEVFSSIEHWASKLLLGGGKVKGWTMFCCACVFFHETPVGDSIAGRRLGPSRLCNGQQFGQFGTITTIVGNRGIGSFFYLPPKNHGTWYEWTKISGERETVSPVFVVFVAVFSWIIQKHLFPSNSNILHSRLPNICWDPPCQSSPWM